HAGRDDVEAVGVQPGDECAEVRVDAVDLVDAQFGEDLAVQCDGRAGELAAVLEAVRGLARAADGDGAVVDGVLQGGAVTAALAPALGRSAAAGGEGQCCGRERRPGDARDACGGHAVFLRLYPPSNRRFVLVEHPPRYVKAV